MNFDFKLFLDFLMNLCFCLNSGSFSQESVVYKVCNFGFEVFCFFFRNSLFNKLNVDYVKEVDFENGEEIIRGGKQSSLYNEFLFVIDLIIFRRVIKFRIQRSFGESSENIRQIFWSFFYDQNNSADNVANVNKKIDEVFEFVKLEGFVGLILKFKFRSENFVKKEACFNVILVSYINEFSFIIFVYILRYLRMCDLLYRVLLVCKLWY